MKKDTGIVTKIDKQGRLLVPAELREKLGMAGETPVLLETADGALLIETLPHAAKRLRGAFKEKSPQRVASEELIAERRAEAARD